ncbi:MAG TPA: MGMT family protein [Patescibacteria group bacterium]|nr:MGMT family protein [Patescibacteria group bacterium]
MKNTRQRTIDWSRYTPFQQRVLKVTLRIPQGKVLTYKQVAEKLGNPNLARAVGNALGSNLDAPFVPCHRVIGSHSLGGYSAAGGVKTKIRMLKKEGYLK